MLALVGLAVVLVAGGTVAAVALRQRHGAAATSPVAQQLTEQQVATAWSTQAQHALQPLLDRTPALETAVNGFLTGAEPAPALRAEADRSLAAFEEVAGGVRTLAPFPYGAAANSDYLRCARLYVEWARIDQVLAASPPGELRAQLGLMARRVRELGDRVFDRGQDLVTPRLHLASSPDIQQRLPLEVPDWQAEGLEAGPPLAPATPLPAGAMPVKEGVRPTQSRAAWTKALRNAGLPAPGELGRDIDRADAAGLGQLAHGLEAIADRLDGVADPVGGRQDADLARLSILVHAEAARNAEAAALVDEPGRTELAGVARVLARLGDELWPPGLPDQASGA